MKKIILIFTIVLITISCNNSNKLVGNWKAIDGTWKAKIIKEKGELILIGGGIYHGNSKFRIQKNGNDFVILIPPIMFPLKYEDEKLYFNSKEWIKE